MSDQHFRECFPSEHAESLKNVVVQLTAHAIAIGRSKFILRKLFVAVRRAQACPRSTDAMAGLDHGMRDIFFWYWCADPVYP